LKVVGKATSTARVGGSTESGDEKACWSAPSDCCSTTSPCSCNSGESNSSDCCTTPSPCSCTNLPAELEDRSIPCPVIPPLPLVTDLTVSDRFDHILARWGVNRSGHRKDPGLYTIGTPTPDSPVIVTANYTLSVDAVRKVLAGIDCYLLVLDTKGINVWCAAGKGTFGTAELIRKIAQTGLSNLVRHRTLILPQLGAPGVAAHEVRRLSGFRVEYGPIRADDLPRYLETRVCTPEMRRVRFPLKDRAVLIPVELVQSALYMVAATVILLVLAGPLAGLAAVAAVLAGTVIFPLAMPLLPVRDYTIKGLMLGAGIALPFAWAAVTFSPGPSYVGCIAALAGMLAMSAVTAYLALNFTGATPFPSRTGVRTEIFSYVPAITAMFVIGCILMVALGVLRLMGVW
jgi:hypothetical protein